MCHTRILQQYSDGFHFMRQAFQNVLYTGIRLKFNKADLK